MVSKYVRALALRVVYHVQQKLPDLHGQPTRTLVMMISAFIAGGGPWLSTMGRTLVDLPGSLQEKVKRMSRFLCQSRFEVREAFTAYARGILETIAHAHPHRDPGCQALESTMRTTQPPSRHFRSPSLTIISYRL